MNLGQLRYAKGSIRRRKRLGAGRGSGRGGTCGKGSKGLLCRSGGKVHPWFEGGQMPLQRRLPKRGFTKRNRVVYQAVNVGDLERIQAEGVIDAAALAAGGLVKDPGKPVKLLGGGEVKNAYSLKVTAASGAAVEKIAAAGGTVETAVPTAERKKSSEGAAASGRDTAEAGDSGDKK